MTRLRLASSLLLLVPFAACLAFAACNSVDAGQSRSTNAAVEDAAQVARPELHYYIILET